MQPKAVIAGLIAAHHSRYRSELLRHPGPAPFDQRQQFGVIASFQLVARNPIPLRAVQRHKPRLLTQFDGNENCATMAAGGRAYGRCLHPTSPMVRVWKPKPIGKATLTAPWNLRFLSRNDGRVTSTGRPQPALLGAFDDHEHQD